MGVLEANTTLIYGVHIRESANDGSDFTNAAADYRVLFLGEDGLLHVKDSAGTVSSPYSSASFTGLPAFVIPQGLTISDTGTIGSNVTNATGQLARSANVIVPASMRLRSLWIHVTSAAAGSIRWGLYDYSSSVTAATELATGTAAPGGTGWREIAATSAPVVVGAGAYMLIVENPLTNPSTISVATASGGSSSKFFRAWSTYTWDTTPDVVSASWGDSSIFYNCYLEGDVSASGDRL
jgi:hypothetical protein